MKIGRFEATRDSNGWTLTETRIGKARDGGAPKAQKKDRFYASLKQCCDTIIDLSAADAGTVQEVLDAIDTAKKEILAAIQSAGLK